MRLSTHIPVVGRSYFLSTATVVPVLSLGLAGCATTASRYPQFENAVDEAGEISVVVDACMATDVRGKVDVIALDINAVFAERISSHVQYELEKQGYRIDTNIVASIGGGLGENAHARAVVSLTDNSKHIETVPLPYFLYAHGLSEKERRSVPELLEALPQYEMRNASLLGLLSTLLQSDPSDAEAVCKQAYSQEGVGFVVRVTGHNRMNRINPDEVIGQAAGAILTSGPFVIPALPVLLPFTVVDGTLFRDAMVHVWALDFKTGRILWHEAKSAATSSGVADPDDIVETLDEVLRHLPDRLTR